ncbi:PilZ domain-containing protein [Aurantiacibacter sp. MUD11]|uniref:PilZ domain-containing protein n=1 Tax=Aurantiacibacter sp. MUD11 TaxID=3003265 RepID=UPI0022AB10C5|nr:PilZ domain-containing protein [Aurantiacibacter sp. MUD11]WAT18235.1 PilZ domain-containing protein [Aurantiacibacter sp. MUD11]
MKLFTRAKPDPFPERRTGPRTRVDCLATMLMPSGDRPGRLFDISTTGARFTTECPPAKGVSAILDWSMYEAYCMVVWSKPGMCGVEFDKPIPQKVIDDLVEAAPAGPRLVHSADDNAGEGPQPSAPPRRFVC